MQMLLKGPSPGSSPGEGFDKDRLKGILASLTAAAASEQDTAAIMNAIAMAEAQEKLALSPPSARPAEETVVSTNNNHTTDPEAKHQHPENEHPPTKVEDEEGATPSDPGLNTPPDNNSFDSSGGAPRKVEPELFKVKMCRAWQQGKCIYGPRCIYAHTPAELRTRDVNAQLIRKLMCKEERCKVDPNKYKVRLCEKFAQNGQCPYAPHCMFAHGSDELRSVSSNREVARRVAMLLNIAPPSHHHSQGGGQDDDVEGEE
eukprot:PhF_6_TR12862/c3_g1_i1/m.20208